MEEKILWDKVKVCAKELGDILDNDKLNDERKTFVLGKMCALYELLKENGYE